MSMSRLHIGLMLPTAGRTDDGQVDAARVLEVARRAEAAGFDGVYAGDHLLHPRPLLESVVTLAAVAGSTEHVAVGTCVMLIALRQPLVLAKQLGTLARFAPRRVRLGVGVGGEYPAEFHATGVPLAVRGRRAEDAVREVRALLGGTGTGADGRPVTITPAAADIPVLFAGRKEPSLERAARWGDGWVGYLLTPDGFARRRQFLLQCRADHGLEAARFTTGMLFPLYPATTADAEARAAAAWGTMTRNDRPVRDGLVITGGPDVIVEKLRAYEQAGCREMVLSVVDQGDGYLERLELLADEVLPRLRGRA
jgi:alkanesulfonate monooxygenase SsuD/methylene tetrahydromethanopterin reductase-like flavin-dependent oxidoreductase (luciferase family)